jgi:hypothetical protein
VGTNLIDDDDDDDVRDLEMITFLERKSETFLLH